MGAVELRAWGDESIRTVGIDAPSYLLGAVVADATKCDGYRDDLRRLLRRGRKLHWRECSDRERTIAVDTIAGFNACHVVVIASPVDLRRQERARALCLERLAWELDQERIALLTLEARPPQLMRRDRKVIDALRGRRALPAGLRIEHEFPSEEPMLWIADQVLGALGELLSGRSSAWFDTIAAATTIVRIEL